MEIFFGSKKETKKVVRTPKEVFHSTEKVVEKLMQPTHKIHTYNDDDLIDYLSQSFDLMAEIDKEMGDLVKISDYPNFKEKCVEFEKLCDNIKEFVKLSIDNLTHFSSFKRLEDLIEERDRAEHIFKSLSVVDDGLDPVLEVRDGFNSVTELDERGFLGFEDIHVDHSELEEAKSRGLFQGLSMEDEESSQHSLISKDEDLRKSKTRENLNKLILKRIDNMKICAKERNPFEGPLHQERVKDIKEGKFKICVPAVALTFKYLVDLFTIIRKTMKDAIQNKQRSSFKTFMVYASKFSLISEILFAAFYAKDDMLYKDLSDESWEKFFKVYDFYEPVNLKKFNNQYQTLCDFLALGNAFISKAGNHSNAFSEFFGQARYAAYYLFFRKKRMEQFDMFMSNPDIDLCLKVYNIPETDFIQKMTEVTLPKIKMHKVVYLPMLDEKLTVENLRRTSENYQKYAKEKELGLNLN